MTFALETEPRIRPFLKWAGGKFRIIDRIREVLPAGDRLIEPFAGSGAVFLNTSYKRYLVADSNKDLINVFRHVCDGGEEFIDDCRTLFHPDNNAAEPFYRLRDEFNNTADLRRKAALFIYLNRHCFNGLCRYNSRGGFNVPFGRYAGPTLPEAALRAFARHSKSAEFEVLGFLETMERAVRGDVVYCDPPYVPISETANFTDYTLEGFGPKEQELLAKKATELARRGVPVIISNHDTPFTRSAYKEASITAFGVQRFISCDATTRGKADELLAVFA